MIAPEAVLMAIWVVWLFSQARAMSRIRVMSVRIEAWGVVMRPT
jgi:hypothetical protein